MANLTLRCPLELRRCHLSGPIDLAKSKGPDLSLAASHLSAPLNGYRLRLDHDLDLRHCTCRGGIRLPGAHIGGQIACAGAELSNDAGPALDAGRLTVDCGLFLRDGFTATGHGELGTIRLPGAHIGGQIACAGAELSNDTGPALVLADTTLGSLHLAPDVGNDPQWSLSLSGATYQGIPTGASLEEWLTLLMDHTRGYTAQPWQQLAAVHRAVGHERDARRILIAQQDDGRRRLLRPPPGSRWPIRLQGATEATCGYCGWSSATATRPGEP